MKKLLFALLTAACFAGAASAVTDSWSTTAFDGAQTSSFSIGIVFRIDDVSSFLNSTRSSLIAMAYSSSISDWTSTTNSDIKTGPNWCIATDGKIYGKASAGNIANSGIAWDTSKLKVGENSACVTVVINGTTATYTLYINGEQAATATHSSIASDKVSFSLFETYSAASAVYYMSGEATSTDIASLPEPTALALLALGAAGLALRRKAA